MALPWMWGMSYSRGYDFFLWVYNAWYLGESIGWGDLPNWSPYAACGQPFYKVAGLSDSAMLASLMQAAGVFGGLRIFVLLAYIVASVGLYQLARSLDLNRGAAWLAAAAYVMSWFLTFTVYFQAYLSNLLVYALLPWFVYWVRTSIAERAAGSLWAATAALATCALANPQVAIKIVLIGVWLTLPLMLRGSKWIWWGVWSGIGLVALTFVVFDVVSALRLRSEVLTINARANSYVGPFTLVAVPAFAFGLLNELLGGERRPGMELWELLYAEHPGLVAVVLAVMALVWERKIMVTLLWGGVAVGYALFFFVLPYLPASPWLGISHNIMIVPVFGLALLSGFGATALRYRLILLWDERRAQWASAAVAVLLAIEGYGLLMGLKQWGTSGIEPRDLPEVAVWKELAEPMRADGGNTRFFTFNPDWTIGLFPVVTGLPTANVIELRQRSADYQAYLDLIVRCSKTPDCRIQPSRLLAPLNVSYVDVP
ncbi:MAG: hypothetical protein VX293_00030, partial [Candidatus Latescibacterota bacterium]|nr:hypothetical protein [Candidatus Latescibacterota bacterium]